MHPITWDIDRVFVYLPFFDFPIYWYGLFFALGIYFSQKWLLKLIEKFTVIKKQDAQNLIFSLILGIVAGARLFDVIFYQDLMSFIKHPLELFDLRAGGLSSHGGFIGFLVALYVGSRKLKTETMSLLALISAPTGLLAFFIRIGNFFNQEILGTPYSGPFAVIFTKPLEPVPIIPRHPVVIYEAFSYLCISWALSKISGSTRKKVGAALMMYFGSRMLLEPLKLEQSIYTLPFGFSMGSALSLRLFLRVCIFLRHLIN